MAIRDMAAAVATLDPDAAANRAQAAALAQAKAPGTRHRKIRMAPKMPAVMPLFEAM